MQFVTQAMAGRALTITSTRACLDRRMHEPDVDSKRCAVFLPNSSWLRQSMPVSIILFITKKRIVLKFNVYIAWNDLYNQYRL